MKNKILFLLILAILTLPESNLAQCRKAGDWDGYTPFQGYLATSNSIKISWATNSVYANENFKVYKKHFLNDPWELVASGIRNSYYEFTGLDYSTTYSFKVERYCSDGSYIDYFTALSLTTKDQGYTPPAFANCFGYWYGYTGYTSGDIGITVYWSYNSSVDADAIYKVYYRLNDFSDGVGAWQVSNDIKGRNHFSITGLPSSTSYEFLIEKWCNNSRNPNVSRVVLSTTAPQGQTNTFLGPVVSIWNIGQARANLTFWNHMFAFPGTRLDGFSVYLYRSGAGWSEIAYVPAISSVETRYDLSISGLTPNSYYTIAVMQKYTLNPGETYQSYGGVFGNLVHFKTDPYDVCNSLTGNYTAPAINNSGGTNIYSGIITSASPVTLTSANRKFIAQAVTLNPGFVTAVSGTGVFLADAFTPSNCATVGSRMAQVNLPDTPLVSVSVLEAVPVSKNSLSTDTPPGQNEAGVTVYPNPTPGLINIVVRNPRDVIKQVQIMDVSGRIVYAIKGNHRIIDLKALNAGSYFYRVQTTAGWHNGKILRL